MKNKFEDDVLRKRLNDRTEDVRGQYFRDQTAIVHSMPFRRLKHKTQVFFDPDNDHVCTRIEHVMHVATTAATICKGINEDGNDLSLELATAIGLGHDLGHAPFGHAGETTLSDLLRHNNKFFHEVNGLRVVDFLANNGKGLNLTYAVRDGIICHNGEEFEQHIVPRTKEINLSDIKDKKNYPMTYEACIVRMSDKIAYLGRDIEDALIANIITTEKLPEPLKEHSDNINAYVINKLVLDVIDSSLKTGKISLSDEAFELLNTMKNFNYKIIYKSKVLLDYIDYCEKIIKALFDFIGDKYSEKGYDLERYENSSTTLEIMFGKYIEKMKDSYIQEEAVPYQIVADYISGMTDKYALDCMRQITIPKPISFSPHKTS